MEQRGRPHPAIFIFIGLFFGATGLLRVASNPALEKVRAVDQLQLIAVGVCFGMAVVGIILLVRQMVARKRSSAHPD